VRARKGQLDIFHGQSQINRTAQAGHSDERINSCHVALSPPHLPESLRSSFLLSCRAVDSSPKNGNKVSCEMICVERQRGTKGRSLSIERHLSRRFVPADSPSFPKEQGEGERKREREREREEGGAEQLTGGSGDQVPSRRIADDQLPLVPSAPPAARVESSLVEAISAPGWGEG